MKIELRNVDYRRTADDKDYPPFDAQLFVNGILAATVHNDGYGSASEYRPRGTAGKRLTAEAEAYCGRLPNIVYRNDDYFHYSGFSIASTLSTTIDKIFKDHLVENEKVDHKTQIQREMNNYLVWNFSTGGGGWRTSLSLSIAKLLANPKGPEIIRDAIKEIIPKMYEKQQLQNTNIPESILRAAGLREGQYVKPLVPETAPRQQRKIKKGGPGI